MNQQSGKLNLADIRQEYASQDLSEENALSDALQQFELWMQQALESHVLEPTAMLLSTVSADLQPSARVVLLKKLDSGFVFFTNYESRKGNDLKVNNKAALTFFWPQLERQIRISGIVEKVSESESDEYFRSRPLGSQIGAWASPQSQPIANRQILENKVLELKEKYASDETLPRPIHWGGYRLIPSEIEFWQGRPSRLHDRLLYSLADGAWKIERLAP